MPVTTQRSAALQPAAGASATRRRRRTRLVLLHLCIIALGVVLAILYDRRLRARGGLSFTIVRIF